MIVTADSIERGQKTAIDLPLCYTCHPALTAAAELSVNLPNRDDFSFRVKVLTGMWMALEAANQLPAGRKRRWSHVHCKKSQFLII
jgi:hypothetical protein